MKRPRFPAPQPKGTCRGCQGPITEPRRLTWCSQACKEQHDPYHVKLAVAKRCNWHCELCGKDCSWNAYYAALKPRVPTYAETGLPLPHDPIAFHAHPLYLAQLDAYRLWRREMPKPEYDHIIPHSEGGNFTQDNIRLLCRACHNARTAAWRKTRKKISR